MKQNDSWTVKDPTLLSIGRYQATTLLTLTIIFLVLVACGQSTPPGPNSVGSVVEQASYLLLDCNEGLRILIWDDIPYGSHGSGSASSSSVSSTTDQLFQQSGDAQSADGRGYNYNFETSDCQQAHFTIDDIPYDLNQGTLFLIHTTSGATQVAQLDLDLSGLSPTNDGIMDFGRQTSQIAEMILGSGFVTPIASTDQTQEPTPTAWDEALRTASALEAPPEVVTKFFSEITDQVTNENGFPEVEITATPTSSTELEPAAELPAHPQAGMVYRTDEGLWIVDRSGESLFVIDQPDGRLSPDGRQVLFQPGYDPDIWLADLTTGERRNLTESSGRFHGSPQWWPGQQDLILFGSSEQLGPGFGYPTTVRSDGSDYRILDQEAVGPLALSSGGQMLAYGSFAEAGKIYHWDGATEVFDPADYGLAIEKIFQPAWSPDGRQLAWKVSGNPEISGWSLGIAVFNLEGKMAELFHTYIPMGGGMVPHYLSWSSDGDWLAFVTFNESAEDGRRPSLWIARPDGQGEIRLGTAVDPIWSPNGNQLAFTLFDDTERANVVWIYDTQTGEQSQFLPAGSMVVEWLPPTEALFQHLQPGS